MNLIKEKSCGCIIVKDDKVLLIYEKNRNFWGFPKGHVEKNEKEVETAHRECLEEVGLDTIIDDSKRYVIKYLVDNKIEKEVIFFQATVSQDNVMMQQEEIEKYKWCSFNEAEELLSYEDLKKVFREFLLDYKNIKK